MRLALGQVNPTVGDLEGNAQLVAGCLDEARRAGADIALFPELVISGYPPEDLLLKEHFIDDCREALHLILPHTAGITAVVGLPLDDEGTTTNAAAVLADGEVLETYRKIFLPNYAVFDEERYFTPGGEVLLLEHGESRLSLNICEDIWYGCGPAEEAALLGGAEVILNISMSPYHHGKGRDRELMLAERARQAGAFILYLNGVGGQDELIFDGDSLVIDPHGKVLARGPQFAQALLVVDLEPAAARAVRGTGRAGALWPLRTLELPAAGRKGPLPPDEPRAEQSAPLAAQPASLLQPLAPLAEVYQALCLGVRDYVRKNGFGHVVIGMSGGIDSALTAAIAADALGADRVTAVSMPSRFSGEGTQTDAREVSARLGLDFREVPIETVFSAFLDTLAPLFTGRGPDLTEENLQARIRGNVLMALSNKFGWLVLTTGNKSEMAVGYATLYGDMAGGFAVIKDVPKTMVYRLAAYRNTVGPGEGPFPQSILVRPPSAELRPDQTDQDSLPPYELLDRIVQAYVVEDLSVDEIVAGGLDRVDVQRVVSLIDHNEYKRRQAAPGVRITPKAFGKDRRLPITNRYRG